MPPPHLFSFPDAICSPTDVKCWTTDQRKLHRKKNLTHPKQTRTTIIGGALRRHAHSLINDPWIDAEIRALIRYGLETNDPCLTEMVRRADAGESIAGTLEFSEMLETDLDDSNMEKIDALAELIPRAGDAPEVKSAALFVLMETLTPRGIPSYLQTRPNTFAFRRCGEFNRYGLVNAQLAMVEASRSPAMPAYSMRLSSSRSIPFVTDSSYPKPQ